MLWYHITGRRLQLLLILNPRLHLIQLTISNNWNTLNVTIHIQIILWHPMPWSRHPHNIIRNSFSKNTHWAWKLNELKLWKLFQFQWFALTFKFHKTLGSQNPGSWGRILKVWKVWGINTFWPVIWFKLPIFYLNFRKMGAFDM